MSLDLPFKFLLFGRLHIKDLDPSSLMLIIVILELGPTTYGSNVVATFSTRSMFCVVDSRVGDEPNVANPPFPKRNKHKLKFVGFFGGAMDPTNCNRSDGFGKQCEGKNFMKLTFNIWGHLWKNIWHTKRIEKSPIFTKHIIENWT